MRSNKTKNIVLSALTLALIYIWYGNAKLFWGDETSSSLDTDNSKVASSRNAEVVSNEPIEFIAPKINPFAESAKPVEPSKSQPVIQRNKRNQPKQAPLAPLLSSSYKLVGSLNTGNQRMATLSDHAGKQVLIARGDSLSGWKAVKVRDKSIVFAQAERRDTLRLPQVSLE